MGFVCAIPTSERTININDATSITTQLPASTKTFLLTSEITAELIRKKARLASVSTVQILAHLSSTESEKLSKILPDIEKVQVIHIQDRSALELIDRYAPYVNAFLLDSGRPDLSPPEYGGTGRTHDWTISAEFVRRSPLPVFLAGGLTPDNVGEAIRKIRPNGVDLCSGVRSNGRLDSTKLEKFIAAVRKIDLEIALEPESAEI